MNIYRREKLRELMQAQNFDALFISRAVNRYYLSGFELHDVQDNESAGYLLLQKNKEDFLFTDSRYDLTAKQLWPEDYVYIYKNSSQAQTEINQFLKKLKISKIGFEASSLSVSFFNQIKDGINFQPADGLVEELRIIKEPQEILLIKKSAALNHKLMNKAPDFLQIDRSEKEIAWDIERFFKDNGADENAFKPIVAIGTNAALPHAAPGNKTITDNCPVLIDVGARLDDYNSDQTRVFWVGQNPAQVFVETLELVKNAQQHTIKHIRPGIRCAELYFKAKDYFATYKVDQYFTHALGHGLGLETHEAPRLNPNSQEILKPGMIITVEPGLYYPEWGGVRWEYMILVTEHGHEIL